MDMSVIWVRGNRRHGVNQILRWVSPRVPLGQCNAQSKFPLHVFFVRRFLVFQFVVVHLQRTRRLRSGRAKLGPTPLLFVRNEGYNRCFDWQYAPKVDIIHQRHWHNRKMFCFVVVLTIWLLPLMRRNPE